LVPSQVQEKIAQVLDRAAPKDLKDGDSRAKFLAALPAYLYGTIGGNTACLEVSTDKGASSRRPSCLRVPSPPSQR
ncbi:MAG: hypothetical protein LBS64_01100, partial [Spirochaetaceae bacterium]|nr:hypothetical protein [Spirochaetaceae bacterium]